MNIKRRKRTMHKYTQEGDVKKAECLLAESLRAVVNQMVLS
jgi:hypothetical protein